jgi:hypothetical protein
MAEFIQGFLKRPTPQDVTWQDFVTFLRQGIEEHQNLEYKPRGLLVRQDGSLIPNSNNRELIGFSALAKAVSSFANAEGGMLVLGVKEKVEKHRGTIVKIKSGALSPIPHTVTREILENQLYSRIQHPIEGIKIVPLRKSNRSQASVYLIDIPASVRAPHRVNELYYFQRYNFSTLEMRHYQIADLFGRRERPDLVVTAARSPSANDAAGHTSLEVSIANRGRALAKHVTAICTVLSASYRVFGTTHWQKRENDKVAQFHIPSHVVYPDIPSATGKIEFSPRDPAVRGDFEIEISVYAENMPGKSFRFSIPLNAA